MSAATVAAIATVASVGVGVAGAAGAFNPDAPSPVNYGAVTRDAQQAQIDLLPSKFKAASQYDPQFAALQQQIAYNNFFGTKAGSHQVQTAAGFAGWKNSQTGETTTDPLKAQGGMQLFGGSHGTAGHWVSPWQPINTPAKYETVQDAATPGTLGMMEQAAPRLNELAASANTTARTNTIKDVANLGPAALAALKGYDPQATGLADLLASQAQDELKAGTHLTPSEERQVQQYVRGGQSARGLGMGPADVFTEAMSLGTAGENRLQQRQAFAGNVINQRSQLYGDPFLAIAGQQSGRTTNPGTFSAGPSTTLDQINPGSTPYSLAQFNANNTNQANIAGYNQQMAGIGGLAQTNWGSLFGQVGGMFKSSPKVPAGVPFYS